MPYAKELRRIVQGYLKAGQPWPATKFEIAHWAYGNGLWEPHPERVVRQLADDLGRALREEHITDPQGRRVRAKHALRTEREGEQITLWIDLRTAGRDEMERAFRQRRDQVVRDCAQLRTDVDSYNQNYNDGRPIQIGFDFSGELAGLALAA